MARLNAAIPSPPMPGPTIAAICQALERQVTALWKSSSGTSSGMNAQRAGNENAPATPMIPRKT